MEALLIDTACKSAQAVYNPVVLDFDGAEEGDLKRKLKVQIKPKPPAEVSTMGALLLIPEMTYELGVKVSQSRLQIDRGSDYGFVLAVQDCINQTVTIASRATTDEHTVFNQPVRETSTEELFQNGSIATVWLSGMTAFEEFADVPLSTDGPPMKISLSSVGE